MLTTDGETKPEPSGVLILSFGHALDGECRYCSQSHTPYMHICTQRCVSEEDLHVISEWSLRGIFLAESRLRCQACPSLRFQLSAASTYIDVNHPFTFPLVTDFTCTMIDLLHCELRDLYPGRSADFQSKLTRVETRMLSESPKRSEGRASRSLTRSLSSSPSTRRVSARIASFCLNLFLRCRAQN